MDKYPAAVRALVLADCGDVDGLRHVATADGPLDVNTPIEAPPSAFAKGCVPLHYACRSGHVAVVTYLLNEQHADPCLFIASLFVDVAFCPVHHVSILSSLIPSDHQV